jgi:predicted DCC family thiol-disulfide oxidoreductase YuxK
VAPILGRMSDVSPIPEKPHLADGAARTAPGQGAVLLFDGVCNFCNGTVVFIIERDPAGYFQFASLQSTVGVNLVTQFNLAADVSTIVLIQDGQVYRQSAAVLRVMQELGPMWRVLATFGLLIPRVLRDWGYTLFARYRYTLFGRTEQCMVPTPDIRRRFLANG